MGVAGGSGGGGGGGHSINGPLCGPQGEAAARLPPCSERVTRVGALEGPITAPSGLPQRGQQQRFPEQTR